MSSDAGRTRMRVLSRARSKGRDPCGSVREFSRRSCRLSAVRHDYSSALEFPPTRVRIRQYPPVGKEGLNNDPAVFDTAPRPDPHACLVTSMSDAGRGRACTSAPAPETSAATRVSPCASPVEDLVGRSTRLGSTSRNCQTMNDTLC